MNEDIKRENHNDAMRIIEALKKNEELAKFAEELEEHNNNF